MRDRGKTGHGRCFSGRHPPELRQFRDKHGRRDRPDPGDGQQKPCPDGRRLLLGDDASDPPLQVTDLSVQRSRQVGIPSRSAGMFCFLRGEICAEGRLRLSTTCARRVVKALRIRSFSSGNLLPASGLNSMNRAMGSASIRSVFARVPRERAKALICAGGSCTASTPAATSVVQSTHS